ncbi:MAG: sulfurtransferase [Alphaproteobacteria bacterium]|nr:MAG: sulfurtransferase [Alphaproteobacteria bacterium]
MALATMQCDVRQLQAMLNQSPGPCLIDVREKWELDICTLPNALHIPLGLLPQQLADLPKEKDIVLFCHHGMRSLKALSILQAAGYSRAISLQGGIHAWAEQIDPGMKKY